MELFNGHGMAFTIESLSLKMLTFAGKKIESWYSVPLNPNFVKDGLVFAPQDVGKVMAEAVQEKGVPRSSVLSALPSTGSAGQVLTLPRIKGGKMEDVVIREVKRLMPGAADVDYIYWQAMANGVTTKEKQAIYALAVPRNNVINMVETCRTAGLKLKGLELRPFALARAVNCKSGIIVHGEVDTIEIVIVDKSFPGLFRNIPVKDANPSLEAAWQNLIRELPFTVDYYNRSHHDSSITAETAIYLSGGLALDPEMPARLAQATGRKVARVEPPPGCPQNFPLEQYLVNVGLMLKEKW
jgi:Tfp pilus assembly PilM family ATPase